MGLIYEATNLINHKRYIGQTIQTLEERKGTHEYDAVNRQRDFVFYRAIRKYGFNNFQWRIIGYCKTKKQLDKAEIACIEFYQSNNPIYGYNSTIGGTGGAIRSGMKCSDSMKRKIGEANRGRIVGEAEREMKRQQMLGTKLSEETKRRMSEARKGQKRSEESKQKMREAQRLRRLREQQ